MKLKTICFPLYVSLIYLFLYLPIIVLIFFSFNKSSTVSSWTGFTLDWYNDLFQSKEIWNAFKNSLIVASSSVVLSLTMSVFFVWGLKSKFYYLISLFYSSMVIPDIVMAAGLLVFFSFFSISLGFTTLIAGHTLLGLGFAVPMIYSRYLELENQVVEASLDLGASDWQTFLFVVLPFLSPALVSSALSVFILSLDDFIIAFFCSGSSSQTLSLYIFAIIRAGASPMINALSAIILLISSILVLLFSFVKIKDNQRLWFK